ncbi:glycosyltransferase family 2 protein [candidate division CSSED10-310 bacterium]|uniref:Glycosyltransferase family 2 protein n=1 Tax=candidate division CSSED10-310 bacterium TaxID=2855610 RepID=A0ABV6Z0A6_UNCC1
MEFIDFSVHKYHTFPTTMNNGSALPRISVVTPNYNYERYLEDTIQSIVGQGYPNLEYVVIDDGSVDGSFDIIKKYVSELAYHEQQKNQGQAHAINRGFANTTGEIMAWLNSDDKYMPWTFAVVADIFTRFPDIDWITGVPSVWDEWGRNVQIKEKYKNIYDFLLGNYGWIQQESVFWRRSLWEKAGSYIVRDYKFQIDCELWCRFFQHAELWHVSCLLGGYRKHSAARTRHHISQTQAEAQKAVAQLKMNCSEDILREVDFLKRLQKMRILARYLNLNGLFRHIFKKKFKKFAYKVIYWDEEWHISTKPYNLFR